MAYIPKPGDHIKYTRRHDKGRTPVDRSWYKALVVKEITPDCPEAQFGTRASDNPPLPCFLIKTVAGHYHERSLEEYVFLPEEPSLEVKWLQAVELLKQFRAIARGGLYNDSDPEGEAVCNEIDALLGDRADKVKK